ncbi:hypothetical protein BGZ95_005662 [Linnemannia exigua]|uniref:Uncharacterized protein n=1 Tax=Linnemannia exigua TaxID=604196 RepID=A0AAD4H063_9FUNG|nr:hypothetical protein BGZ95_005662 [Linnemannia exigua]
MEMYSRPASPLCLLASIGSQPLEGPQAMSKSESEHSQEASWNAAISADRKGAGYFLSPQDYIHFRAVKRDQSSCLIDEWTRWLSELKANPHGGVRRAAVAASPLTQQNLDKYYCGQFFIAVPAIAPSSTTHGLDTAAEVINPSAERETAEQETSAEKGLVALLKTVQESDHLEEVDIGSSEDEPKAHHLEIS